MSKVFTKQELSAHTSDSDLFMSIRGKVYDVTKFIQDHPGGEEVLLELGGQDATEAYEDIGHSESADEMLNDFLVGTLDVSSEEVKTSEKKVSSVPVQTSSSSSLLPILLPILIGILFLAYKNYA